jgi:hypothetical protein
MRVIASRLVVAVDRPVRNSRGMLRRMWNVVLAASLVVAASAGAGGAAAPSSGREGWSLRHRPTRGLAELGVHGGAFLPRQHELFDPRQPYEPLRRAGPEFGARLGFYPLTFLGVELESGLMPTRTTITDSPAMVIALRAHAIAQLPYRLAPFVLVGVGALLQSSRRLGGDVDPALHFGGGLKLFLTRAIALRLDFRAHSTGQGGVSGGHTRHLEALIGVSVTLGRKPPRSPVTAPSRRSRP